jgi:ubiquinone/menaquinone biosynthesis C-methylase UbiE
MQVAAAGHVYEAFPNMEARNGLQERIEVPLMLRALGIQPGGRILEVGCGRGIAMPVFAERLQPETLVGVDVDPALVAIARRRLAALGVNATVVEADVRDLPFDAASFDLVVDFGTCYHVSGGDDGALAALREIGRVLRPGGRFVHETPVAQHVAHPIRSFLRTLPWDDAPWFTRERARVLWSSRRKAGP